MLPQRIGVFISFISDLLAITLRLFSHGGINKLSMK